MGSVPLAHQRAPQAAENYAIGGRQWRTNPPMTLILKTMKKHMGWEDAKDDFVILDDELWARVR